VIPVEEKLNLILNELKNLKTDVTGFKTEVREEFNKIDNRFSHLEKEIYRNRFLLEADMNSQYAEMSKKQDKILSAIDSFATRTEKNETEITVLSHRIREHEDRITALEEKAG